MAELRLGVRPFLGDEEILMRGKICSLTVMTNMFPYQCPSERNLQKSGKMLIFARSKNRKNLAGWPGVGDSMDLG